MRPVTVASYEEFVATFGDPVAGGDSSGDVWRSGVPAGPTYGGYAAQAWLANNPTVTYLRLLGVQSEGATGTSNNSGQAGWTYGGTAENTSAKGAYGLYVFPYPMPQTSGSLVNALVVASNVTDTKIAFKVTVPTSVGGQGAEITFKAMATLGAAGADNVVQYLRKGTGAGSVLNLIDAINGTSDTAKVRYGTTISGTPATNGIIGLSASIGGNNLSISLFARNAGTAGNFALTARS